MINDQPGTHVDAQGAQGIQSGGNNIQHNYWGIIFGGRQPGGKRRLGGAAIWCAVFGCAVIATASCLIAVNLFASPLMTARVVGNSPLFSDPNVVSYMNSRGFVISQDSDIPSQGSWDICDESAESMVKNYDVANLGDSAEAQCVQHTLTNASYGVTQIPFNDAPLVIVTHPQYEEQLEKAGVVRDENGIHVFNVACYLQLVSQLPAAVDAQCHQSQQAVPSLPSLAVTSPTDSNSGSMFVAIGYMALAKGKIAEPFDHSRLNAVRMALDELDDHTPDLMSVFLNGTLPMAAVYENDYLYDAIHHKISPADNVVVMYPNPDIVSHDTLVSWDAAGDQLLSALTSPEMEHLSEEDGYRANQDSPGFVSAMRGIGYPVPDIDSPPPGLAFDVAPPSGQVLQQLAKEVNLS